MSKALSVMQVLQKNNHKVQFDGNFQCLIGNPALSGAWLIWGNSGNGKTAFLLQLLKYLTQFGRVAFNSLEEGSGESIKVAFETQRMQDVNRKLILLDNEPYDELINRLDKKKSPSIIAIDSIQYFELTWKLYKELKERYKNKLFIFTSHAEGKFPAGRIANRIRFDVPVKIRVEGYKAFNQGRYITDPEPYIIWDRGSELYWGKEV